MENLDALLADLETVVRCESPSADLAAVARSAEVVASIGTRLLGFEPEYLVVEGRTHLRWRLGDGVRRVLVLAHHDTVWPLGSLESHPFGIDDGVLRGPGCFDMKTGLVMALHAIAALPDSSGVTLLVNGDEELGSPTSRSLIEAEAAGCVATLVLEASADGGALKTARKGISRYQVAVRGRASHAGLDPEAGVNASIEAAHQVLAVSKLGDVELGTTVTPTVLTSGTTTNTVPAAASFAVDVRVRSVVEQDRVHAAMLALQPVLPEAELEISGGHNRPPFERSSAVDLYELACRLADKLGLDPLPEASVGGASDGNFTAGMGIPTLDGLDAVGGGAHADHEHVIVAEIPHRTALLVALLTELLAGEA